MLKLKKMLFILLLVLTTMFVDALKQDLYRIGYTTEYRTGSKYIPTGSTYLLKSSKRRSPENPKPKDPPTYNPFSITFWNWYNSEEGQDWVRINGSPWGIISDPDPNWPSYVDDDYWDWFIENYPEYEENAAQWFYDRGETPPWMTPIGDMPIILLIVFCLATCYRIATKNKISSF